jgi:hypothetical protein
MHNNKQTLIRKVDLKALIDTLVEVYNSGADYIDIIGHPDEEQDTIGIIVHDDYMADPNDLEEGQERIETEEEDKPLSDEDLNQLI